MLLDNEDCVQIVVLENTILTKLPVTKDCLEKANDTTYTTLHHDTANVDIICVVPRHSVSLMANLESRISNRDSRLETLDFRPRTSGLLTVAHHNLRPTIHGLLTHSSTHPPTLLGHV